MQSQHDPQPASCPFHLVTAGQEQCTGRGLEHRIEQGLPYLTQRPFQLWHPHRAARRRRGEHLSLEHVQVHAETRPIQSDIHAVVSRRRGDVQPVTAGLAIQLEHEVAIL
jgi:hypothetical protein